MKQVLTAVCAAAFGAFVGSYFGQTLTAVRAAVGDKVETKELVLLDEHGKPAARMMCSNNRTVLQFYAGDGSPALEVGVGRAGPERFIHLLGAKGRVLAALNSLPPNGETTLYLDHLYGDTLDNRRNNLRKTDRFGNTLNLPNRDPTNTSGYRGVHKRKDNTRFEAYIRKTYLGSFDDALTAAIAVWKRLAKLDPIAGEN